MKKIIVVLFYISCLFVLLDGCSRERFDKGHDYSPIAFFDSCQEYDFNIQSLPYEEMPNTKVSLEIATDTAFPRDEEGVRLYEHNGQYYYHPVSMCHTAINILDAYYTTGDSKWLHLAEKYVHRLVAEADVIDSTLYYPYNFEHKVHQRDDALLPNPWYSGMAEGVALRLLVRVFEATGDSTYLDYANKTFRSFLRLKGEAEPWTVFVDSCGCYWAEEYTLPEPSMTLNGFIAAIYGLYEYNQLVHSEESERILKISLGTVKNYVPLFRRPGKPSLYNIRFRHYAADYHGLHIEMLRYLEKMTADSFFGAWADTFYIDYHDSTDSHK